MSFLEFSSRPALSLDYNLDKEKRPPDLTPSVVRAALNLRPMVVRMPATTLEPDTSTQRMHLESLSELESL